LGFSRDFSSGSFAHKDSDCLSQAYAMFLLSADPANAQQKRKNRRDCLRFLHHFLGADEKLDSKRGRLVGLYCLRAGKKMEKKSDKVVIELIFREN
jgi:hypothetical protein